jgi:NAD(P)-dependent dehydrogenase (short-subunit alcohol dehydrogenase family)
MPNELAGQVAVVTGAGRGFGRAIAERYAAEGASVVITSRSHSELDEVVRTVGKAGGQAHAVVADVTNWEDVVRVRDEAEATFGPVSVVVSNAGVPWPFGPVWYVKPEEWWAAQEVHVRGALYYINAFVPGMVERKNGRFIVVSSTASQQPRPNLSGYATAKATQNRLVEHLALEGKEHGVYAWAIQPGSVFTGISTLTVSDPDAQKYIPGFVEHLHHQKANDDPSVGLNRCAEMCVELASGRCDALSGRFLMPSDDFAALAKEAASGATHP